MGTAAKEHTRLLDKWGGTDWNLELLVCLNSKDKWKYFKPAYYKYVEHIFHYQI